MAGTSCKRNIQGRIICFGVGIVLMALIFSAIACSGGGPEVDVQATVDAAVAGTVQAKTDMQSTVDASVDATLQAKMTAEVKSAANTPIAEPTPQPDENVVITTDEFEGVIFQDRDWVPTVEEVRAMEKQLDTYLSQQQDAFDSSKMPIEERLPTYKRQYWGMGKSVIFGNFLCNTMGMDWTHNKLVVDDGGDCYFQIHYDVETGTFFDLNVNGVS